MGNSNSSSHHHQKHPHARYPPGYPHDYPGGWSHSLETPEQRNRMKRGYFPPRTYIGVGPNGHLPQPQKVLPQAVDPNLLLKATSNGAILQKGGTISGRKLSELELEIRKRSTASCPANNQGEIDPHFGNGMSSGRSTPNLLMPRMGISAGIGPTSSNSSRSRDYGSEPDLRDIGKPSPNGGEFEDVVDRANSPVPFTLISESPAKKQIRSRKKSKAPPPPMPHHHEPMMMPFIPYQYQLEQNPQRQLLLTPVQTPSPTTYLPEEKLKRSRLFKTKAETRSPMRSPAPSHELININGKMMRGERERTSAHSLSATASPSNRSGGGNSSVPSSSSNLNKSSIVASHPSSSHPIGRERESKELIRGSKKQEITSKPTPLSPPKPSESKHGSSNKSGMNSRANHTSGNLQKHQAQMQPPPPQSKMSNTNNHPPIHNVPKGSKDAGLKKTFYFGMDMGTFRQRRDSNDVIETLNAISESPSPSHDGRNRNASPLQQAHVADLHKEISRRKMLQKMDSSEFPTAKSPSREETNVNNTGSGQSRSSSRNSVYNSNNNAKQSNGGGNHLMQINGHANNVSGGMAKASLQKMNSSNNRMSESDSDGIHRRQDSGSFDINEKHVGKMMGNGRGGQNKVPGAIRESSSDLSSSDLDMPLVVTRPTLPQKRPELPRFSPTAAWRAIDSPSRISNTSGPSFEMDSGEESRLHRFTRPSAPPRISNERSGDSGISAGDAGSPANVTTLVEEEEGIVPLNDDSLQAQSKATKMMGKGKRGKIKGDFIGGADRMMKCWTPEQDLDESSSDFDQDHDPILPPVPPKPSKSKFNLFEGKRTSAVVSDSDSRYFSGHGAGFHSTDELSTVSTRRFQGKRPFVDKNKRFNPNHHNNQNVVNSSNAYSRNGNNYYYNKASSSALSPGLFVGLDTNWFLSRSEPSSLNFIGIDHHHQQDFRKPLAVPITTPSSSSVTQNKGANKPAKMSSKGGNNRSGGSGTNNHNKEVIVGSRLNNRQLKTSLEDDDEFECELQLGSEEADESSDNHFTRNKRNPNKLPSSGGGGGGKRSSEIGYGPSNMNFQSNGAVKQQTRANMSSSNNAYRRRQLQRHQYSSSSASYEDQEEEIEVREEDEEEEEEEELMRDDLFDYLDQYEEGEFEREQEQTTGNNPKGADDVDGEVVPNRPFSHHIMYLPSYDPRKVYQEKSAQNWRRTRSVDQLDHEVPLFKSPSSPKAGNNERVLQIQVEGRDYKDRKTSVPSYFPSNGEPTNKNVTNVTITSVPLISHGETKMSADEEERRALNKKKFKFQSTLRVQERRKMEEELSREARHKEDERLREIEEMKRVEEAFQKKRKGIIDEGEPSPRPEISSKPFFSQSQSKPSIPPPPPASPPIIVGKEKKFAHSPKPMSNGNGMGKGQQECSRMMSQRQEPEGAPASVTVSSACTSSASSDLRRELITASKKRSANPQPHTQELSEYRQERERRQYCDYRRAPRNHSVSPARYMQKSSSSSDIFPMVSRRKGAGGSNYSSSGGSKISARSTVHPEVVCDIPVKPYPYMVNASRLSGSSTTLNVASSVDERPSSVLGSLQNLSSSNTSSPTVLSDNYRRDWAHHLTRGGVSQGGRASSVLSLHSAPPADSFRNSTSDLSPYSSRHHRDRVSGGPGQNLSRTASPHPSSSPVPSSSRTDSFRQMSDRSSSARGSPVRIRSKSNTTVISIGPQIIRTPSKSKAPKPTQLHHHHHHQPPPPSFQLLPYNSNRSTGYRPVSFKPPPPTTAIVN